MKKANLDKRKPKINVIFLVLKIVLCFFYILKEENEGAETKMKEKLVKLSLWYIYINRV